jgi:hypothetical protein
LSVKRDKGVWHPSTRTEIAITHARNHLLISVPFRASPF